MRSTTSGHLQGRAPGLPVLEGMWQASTQGSESRRKGEGAVGLDPGSQSEQGGQGGVNEQTWDCKWMMSVLFAPAEEKGKTECSGHR